MDGFVHPDFAPVVTALRSQVDRYPGGAALSVFHRGECVVDLWGGVRNDSGGIQIDIPSILDALAPRGIGAFDFGSAQTLQASIPAANGLFTARSLARMYAALANGGMLDGVRLLSQETLAQATEIQAPTASRVVIPFDMRWRLGYHGIFTARGVPHRAFGHFGFGGSGGWADPSRELSLGLIVNSGMGTPFGDTRIFRLSGTVLAAANARGKTPVPAPRPLPHPAFLRYATRRSPGELVDIGGD